MPKAEDHSRSAAMKAIEEELDGALQQAIDRHEFKMSLIGVLTFRMSRAKITSAAEPEASCSLVSPVKALPMLLRLACAAAD